MSNRGQIVLGAVTAVAIDGALYAGVVAAGIAALAASAAYLVWRTR